MESRAKLAGHAVHPMLITLPLGLLGTAVVFDIIRAFTDEADLAVASFYMLACLPPVECSRTLLGESLCWLGHSAESGPHGGHGGLSEDGDVVTSGMDGEASAAPSMDGQVEGRTAYLYALEFDVGEPGG